MNKISMIFSFIFVFMIFGLMTYYIGFKIYISFKLNRFICFGISILMTFIMLFGFMRSLLPIGTFLREVLKFLSSYVMGFYVYLLLFFLISDLVLLIIKLFKFDIGNIKLYSGLFVVVLTLCTFVYGLINGNSIKHVSYNVDLESKEDISDMNIVMISDLHLGAINSENRLKKIVSEINSLNPDLVLIVGDIFDNDYYAIKNPDESIKLLGSIKSTHGVYASLGNHDSGSTFDLMMGFLDKSNINVLMDESVIIDNKLVVFGRLDGTPIGGYRDDVVRGNIDSLFDEVDFSLPLIVLDHNPMNIDEYDNRVDLILSGHTHRGQLFPANIITNLMYEVDYGYYLNDKTHVIVSSGVGTWSMPMRVGSNCEIVNIKIN